jgi:Flp pilus assembly protein TadG
MIRWNRIVNRSLVRGKEDEHGIASVEFALIAPVFFLFLMGITEMSLIMFVEHLLENTTYNASRLAKTGYIEDGMTQYDTVMAEVIRRMGNLAPLLDPAKITVTSESYGDLSDIGQPEQATAGLGTAEEIMVYTISYPWKIFTPMIGTIMGDENNIIKLSSRIVVRNEPYN